MKRRSQLAANLPWVLSFLFYMVVCLLNIAHMRAYRAAQQPLVAAMDENRRRIADASLAAKTFADVHRADAADPDVLRQQIALETEVRDQLANQSTLLASYIASTTSNSRASKLYSWLSLAAMILFATFVFRRSWLERQKRHRLRNNLCVQCGYSLVGNVSGVCPECGCEIPAAASKLPRIAYS